MYIWNLRYHFGLNDLFFMGFFVVFKVNCCNSPLHVQSPLVHTCGMILVHRLLKHWQPATAVWHIHGRESIQRPVSRLFHWWLLFNYAGNVYIPSNRKPISDHPFVSVIKEGHKLQMAKKPKISKRNFRKNTNCQINFSEEVSFSWNELTFTH